MRPSWRSSMEPASDSTAAGSSPTRSLASRTMGRSTAGGGSRDAPPTRKQEDRRQRYAIQVARSTAADLQQWTGLDAPHRCRRGSNRRENADPRFRQTSTGQLGRRARSGCEACRCCSGDRSSKSLAVAKPNLSMARDRDVGVDPLGVVCRRRAEVLRWMRRLQRRTCPCFCGRRGRSRWALDCNEDRSADLIASTADGLAL